MQERDDSPYFPVPPQPTRLCFALGQMFADDRVTRGSSRSLCTTSPVHTSLVGRCRSLGLALAVSLSTATLALAQSPTGTEPDEGIRSNPPSTRVLAGAQVVARPGAEPQATKLLVRDGKIAAMGPDLNVPAGAEVIDLSGKYLYSAFIDSLVKTEASSNSREAGFWNDLVTPELTIERDGEEDDNRRDALREAGVGISHLVPTNGLIKGQSCVATTADSRWKDRVLRPDTFQHMQLYPDRRRGGYPNSPMGAVALVRQALMDAQWYAKAQRAVRADPSLPTPELNTALEQLDSVLSGRQQVVIDGANELYALRADRLAREFSLRLVVEGSGNEYRRIEAIAATNRKYIIPLNFPEAPDVSSREAIAETNLRELMHWRLAPENPAQLEAHGVDFVFTLDGLDKPEQVLKNARRAIKHGLSPEQALNALTLGPAKLLEVDSIAGSISPGKLANFVISDGPIFAEDSKLHETWVQGHRYRYGSEESRDLRGKWELNVTDSEILDGLQIKLTGKPEKLKGEVSKPSVESDDQSESNAEDDSQEEVDDRAVDETQADGDADKDSKPASSKLKKLEFEGYRLSATFEVRPLFAEPPGMAVLSASLMGDDESPELVGVISWPDGKQFDFTGGRVTEEADEETNEQASENGESEEDEGEDESDENDDSSGRESSPDSQKDADEQPSTQVACEVNYPLGAFGVSKIDEQPDWLLVKNATIWTCGEAGILEGADMLVHRGIIKELGRDLSAPDDAEVIDASGMHLSPGIIDCHSHMATDGGVNESGQAITAEVRIGDFIDPNDITIYRQLAGGVTSSNILHGSANPIGGQNQVIKLRWGLLDEEMKMREAPEGIKFALGENVKRSNSRTTSSRYPQSRMGVPEIIRDRFEAALAYGKRFEDWSRLPKGLPPRRDLELEALLEILEGKRWIHCHSYRADEILALLRILEDYDVTIGSLQHILEGYKVADVMAEHGAMASSFSDWWAYKIEVYDAIPYNGALMHDAGIVVSFNSDDAELARHLNHEAAKAVKYGGVAPEEALKFVTLNPAKQLRIDQYVGSLEPGKQADFVLWNRSPLSTLSACQQTWIDGRKYFDREVDAQRRKAHDELHRALIQSIISSDAPTRSESSDDDPSYWWVRYDEFCHHLHGHDEHDKDAGGHGHDH
jgi:imidazolonepropionase-like amidohydrolase